MRRGKIRIAVYSLILLAGLFVVLGGPARIRLRNAERRIAQEHAVSPLEPVIRRPMAVRFDPSYYYRGQRPKELAEELSRRWSEAGVNLVFFRAYDPRFGAFYKTRYSFVPMGEYGQFDLLRAVLEACHARDIEVFAWFPVLNLKEAWERNPPWRAKTKDGADHSETGLEFPLCARNPQARQWWLGLLKDFLGRYPEIDGIDLGEPVISWRPGAACFCEQCQDALAAAKDEAEREVARAEGLTRVLRESVALIHEFKNRACVTTVQSARDSGELLDPTQLRRITGFDLHALLGGPAGSAPDILCPEFIWQEHESRRLASNQDAGSALDPALFSPDWTEQAVREFLGWIDTPAQVIAHVEITDFENAPVGKEDLRAAIRAALRAGAEGIDVYSSSQLDAKNGWPVLRSFQNAAPVKRCLVLYDENGGLNDAVQTGELLRHFRVEVALRTIQTYGAGTIDEFDNVFYVGADESAEPLPLGLLEDIKNTRARICWLGFNIDQLLSDPEVSRRLGLEFVGVEEGQFDKVVYKNTILPKEDPWTNVVKITDPDKCRALAAVARESEQAPFAARSGRRFWFFADVPSAYAIEGGRALVFADLLHEILNEDHKPQQLAMVRIEDVHPLTDPGALNRIAGFFGKADIPFQVSAVPVYAYPEQNAYVRLRERPEIVSALKRMVEKGGSIVMHGTTHQRFGESTADCEFWDTVGDCPPGDQSEQALRETLEDGLREFWSAGLYPLMWETPHYAGSQGFYSTLNGFFSASMERRQAIDRIGTDQYFPYLIRRDRFGQTILPENLGYVPSSNQDPSVILAPARNMKVVRDGVASFFFHPFLDLDVLKQIVNGMEEEGFQFVGPQGLPLRVSASFGAMTNGSGQFSLNCPTAAGLEATLDPRGRATKTGKTLSDTDRRLLWEARPSGDSFSAVHFIRADENTAAPAPGESGQSSSTPMFQLVSNLQGERCRVPRPLLLANQAASPLERAEIEAFDNVLSYIGIQAERQDVSEFAEVAPERNLIIVPEGSGRALSAAQIALLLDAARPGGVDLIASGFTALSDELGIERTGKEIEVSGVSDPYFPDFDIQWHSPVKTWAFESPGDSVFFYADRGTGESVMASAGYGLGRFLFMNVALDGAAEGSARFPHFLTHIMRHFGFFPLVRRNCFEVYFNPAEREGVSIEELVKHWRRSGVRTIYAAAWQVFPEWAYDYERLIRLAHNNAMRVYAWWELPYVNEKFWLDNPQWRAKDAAGKDVVSKWRKPISLDDPECRDAVKKELALYLNRFNWDGAVLNDIGWETHISAETGGTFSEETGAWLDDILALFGDHKGKQIDGWEILASFSPGASAAESTGARLEDWRERYAVNLIAPSAIGKTDQGKNMFDVELVAVDAESYAARGVQLPTSYPTGTALYADLASRVARSKRVALYSENSLFEIDMGMLPLIGVPAASEFQTAEGIAIDSAVSCEVHLPAVEMSELLVDGEPCASFSRNHVILPAGSHTLRPQGKLSTAVNGTRSQTRIVDFSGDLIDAWANGRGIKATYRDKQRALFVLTEEPRAVLLDGESIEAKTEQDVRGWTVILPAGQHRVEFVTRGRLRVALTWGSMVLSNGIVAVSAIAVAALALILATVRIKHRLSRQGSG